MTTGSTRFLNSLYSISSIPLFVLIRKLFSGLILSLKILLPVVQGWFSPGGGDVIVLIKPQFEAGRAEVSRGEGVIRDPTIHRHVLIDVLKFSQDDGYQVLGLIRSPLLGPKGNTEFLSHLKFPLESEIDINKLINILVPESEE